jgi:hypothetical protein
MVDWLGAQGATIRAAAAAFVAFTLFLLGAWAGWQINGWRLESAMSEERLALSGARIAAEEAARKNEQEWNMKYQNATRTHHEVQNLLTNQLALVRRDADGLRVTVADLKRKLSDAAPAACIRAADAALDVFGACADRYIDVATNLDRCDADRRALTDAWPGSSP